MCICVYTFTYLSKLAALHAEPETLPIGQRVASLGGWGLARGGGGAIAYRPPSGHYHLAARLVLIQRALTSINHPVRGGERTVDMLNSTPFRGPSELKSYLPMYFLALFC